MNEGVEIHKSTKQKPYYQIYQRAENFKTSNNILLQVLGKRSLAKFLIFEYTMKQKIKNFQENLSRLVNKLDKVLPSIDVSSSLFHAIQVLFSLVYLYFIILVPYELSFTGRPNFESQYTGLFYILISDALVSLNSNVVEYGQITSERTQILKTYLKTGLLIDSLCLLSIYYPNSLRLVIIFKIQRIQSLFHRIKYNYLNDNFKASIMEILSLVSRILLVTHYFACLWHYLGRSQYM